MAFGCGVLFSAIAYDLIMEGFRSAASSRHPRRDRRLACYTIAKARLARRRPSSQALGTPAEEHERGGGLAIAVGSLLDGIPESIVLGVGLLGGGGVSVPMLAAIFLSNLPEGLSSAAGMLRRAEAAPASSRCGAASPSPRGSPRF